jgi:transcriptional regulator with XRE-family HTH domain
MSRLTLSKALAEKLTELLYTKHWTERDLAKLLNCSQSRINYLLKSKRRTRTLDFYVELAQLWDLELSELIKDLEARVARASDDKKRRSSKPRSRPNGGGTSPAP